VDLICVQRCQDTFTAMAVGCGPTVNPRFGRRLESPPREQQPMRALVSLSDSILVLLPLCFKLEHFIIYVSLL
jgi:hypothetical protein